MSAPVAAKDRTNEASPKKVESAKQFSSVEAEIAPEFSGSIPMLQEKAICPCEGGCPNCSDEIQTKLKIGAPDDEYEQEADETADRIMRMPDSEGALTGDHLSLESGEKENPVVQRQADEENEEGEEEEPEEPVQTKSLSGDTPEPESEPEQNTGKTVQPDLHSLEGGGQPLDPGTREFFEPRFGRDFGSVRVHTGSRAEQLNRQLRAQAFTHGSDIYFNEGKYAPHTSDGKHLLAHELTHVVQQRHGEVRRKSNIPADTNTPAAPTPVTGAEPAPGGLPAADGSTGQQPDQQQDREITFTTAEEPPAKEPEIKEPESKKSEETLKEDKSKPESSAASEEKKPVLEKGAKEDPAGEDKTAKPGTGGKDGGDAEVQKVEQLELAGSSDQAMDSFTTANASQVAASFPVLGGTLEGKLTDEQKEAADDLPPLNAQTAAGAKPPAEGEPGQLKEKNAEINDGVTQPEPDKQEAKPHEDAAPPPENKRNSDLLEKQESGGFLSWFKNKFKNFMSGISTKDSGINTGAGERPTIDTTGKADLNRVENQRQEGQTQVDDQKTEVSDQIKNNPGQQKIQPQPVNEEIKGEMSTETDAAMETPQDGEMARYATLPLPKEVRDKADEKMAPALTESLAKPRQEVASAAKQRDDDKQKAVTEAEEQNDKLNQEADNEQNGIVTESRKEVAEEQAKGIEEAQGKIDEFNTEANSEEETVKTDVDDRIETDEGEASKTLEKAEEDADKEKEKGEEEAAAKKKELEKESEDQSWWDRTVDAVKSAVTAVTEAIDAVFTAVREAVKAIIDKAKEAAIALIEAGRKWIVEKLDKFGKWLKEKVNKYLSAFPALAKKINEAIDSAVDTAREAVNKVADKLKEGVTALADSLASAIDSVLSKFHAGLKAAVQIVGAVLTGDFAEAARIAFMAAMEIAGIDPAPVMDFINRAGETVTMIFNDPIGFFRNVANGVKKGVNKFQTNIKKHLIGGLLGWLTGALSEVEITLPEKFDIKGIFSLVMQILGLTYQNIRAKVVKKLGPKGETIISAMEQGFEFIKELVARGPIVLWEKVKDSLTNLKETVISGIRNWVITTVIKEGIIWILSLLNPASAIVKALKLLFDFVMFLVERGQQIVDFVKSVFNSVGELARGNLEKAAAAVENAMARSVPVIISLLASLLGLGGIGKTVKNIIMKIRKPIDKAMDKVIDWLVKKSKSLFGKGKAALQKGKTAVKKAAEKLAGWLGLKKKFKASDGSSHTISYKGKTKPKIVVRSEETGLDEIITYMRAPSKLKKKSQKALKDSLNADTTRGAKTRELEGVNTDLKQLFAKGDTTSPTDKSNLENLLETAKQNIPSYFLASSTDADLPLTNVTWRKQGEKAHKVIAEPLTKRPGNTKGQDAPGTPIAKGFELCEWIHDKLPRTAKGYKQIKYHQTHLLSETLSGPALDWNLTPTPHGINTGDMKGVEKKVENLLKDNDNPAVVSYETTVEYGHNDETYGTKYPTQPLSPGLKALSTKDFPSRIGVVVKKGEPLGDGGKYEFKSTAGMPRLEPVPMDPPALPDTSAPVNLMTLRENDLIKYFVGDAGLLQSKQAQRIASYLNDNRGETPSEALFISHYQKLSGTSSRWPKGYEAAAKAEYQAFINLKGEKNTNEGQITFTMGSE